MGGSGGSGSLAGAAAAASGGAPTARRALASASMLPRLLLLSAAASALPACAGPSVHVEVQPPSSAIVVDGVTIPPVGPPVRPPAAAARPDMAPGPTSRDRAPVPAPSGTAQVPFLYYGTVAVAALPPSPPPPAPQALRQPVHALVPLPPPAPGWLFPFDFLVDAIGWPWRADPAAVVTLQLPPAGPERQAGVEPPDADALRARARAMRAER